ncbi:hypothetical protein FRC09_020487 [Ceratobasidium sp. 395]|nr:hypothetical protein FRC09_020487 [Ceratobasidium sp. 395]
MTSSRSSIQRATQSKTTRQQDGGLATAQSTSASQTMTPTEVKQDKSKRPPRKRARCSISESMEPVAASTERVPAEHSHLAGLFNVPIDILAEIAVYLHPVDLVYLSRTSKFFRNILMNRASAYIWRSAGLNVQNLPPCPKDISELQYAALSFTESCSFDSAHGVTKNNFVPGKHYIRGHAWCLFQDARAVKSKLNALERKGDRQETDSWIDE